MTIYSRATDRMAANLQQNHFKRAGTSKGAGGIARFCR